MAKLKFFDLTTKKSFTTDKFDIKTKGGRTLAVAKAPSGKMTSRFVKKDFKK